MSAIDSTSTRPLTSYKAIIFDVYGTLIDWESGIYDALKPILPRAWTRKDSLRAFLAVESDLQAKHPDMLYSELLARIHEELERRLKDSGAVKGSSEDVVHTTSTGGSDAPESSSAASSAAAESTVVDAHAAFAASIAQWQPFPDTVPALRKLAKYYKLTVLSNVDRASFTRTHELLSIPSSSGSTSPFTLVLTAQDVGAYKPSLVGFSTLLDRITSDKASFGPIERREDVLSVACSLPHDHAPANALGLDSVFIDRPGTEMLPSVLDGVRYTWRFESLGEFADAVGMEAEGA
jgi:FMN phosphatase YigB (HAD superfamily)